MFTTTVSVIMPCYNASSYLREAIESVLSQSFKDWELLIVDDGSSDNSRQIANEYVTIDERIYLIEQPNSGACRARNNGLEHAKGEFVKFLDADDILESDCLAIQVQQMNELSEHQIPFGDYCNVDKVGKVISRYVFDSQDALSQDAVYFFFCDWHILISAPLHRTDLLREIGGFNESLQRGQESDMHLRLALADVEFVYKPCMTFRYRDHNASTRISEAYQEGTKKRHQSWVQRAHICEELLIKKYGCVPKKYHRFFVNVWFDYAREFFAIGKKIDGINYLNKAKQYGLYTVFQHTYNLLGTVIDFNQVESILQYRLRLVGKKK